MRYRVNAEHRRNPAKAARYRDNIVAEHRRTCAMCGGSRRFSYINGGYVCAEPCSILAAGRRPGA